MKTVVCTEGRTIDRRLMCIIVREFCETRDSSNYPIDNCIRYEDIVQRFDSYVQFDHQSEGGKR